MADIAQTVLETIKHLLAKHPELAEPVEAIATAAQGKGWGAGTIDHEVSCAAQLLGGRLALAIDIGGNVGNYTAEVRRRSPEAEIHIFEPSSVNISKLKSRFANDGRITVNAAAVSSATGEATLYSNSPGSTLGSLTKRRLDHFNTKFDNTERVHTVRFEEYWSKNLQCRAIDLIKIDIEGHELEALNGFGKALDATKLIQFEFGGCNIDTRTFFQDFWYFFMGNGFDIWRITPYGAKSMPRYVEADEFFATTNYFAVNRR